jgi:hypothetical protein
VAGRASRRSSSVCDCRGRRAYRAGRRLNCGPRAEGAGPVGFRHGCYCATGTKMSPHAWIFTAFHPFSSRRSALEKTMGRPESSCAPSGGRPPRGGGPGGAQKNGQPVQGSARAIGVRPPSQTTSADPFPTFSAASSTAVTQWEADVGMRRAAVGRCGLQQSGT